MKLHLKHPTTGITKTAPIGISWTTLFFVFFPALFRGDFKWGAIMLVLACLTGGISAFVFADKYNKIYIKGLLEKGFKVTDIDGADINAANTKLGLDLPTLT